MMDSITIPFFALLLLATPFLSLGQGETNDLRCYVCELEGTDACEDPFDSSQVASAVCNSLTYTNKVRLRDDDNENPDTLVNVDGKFRGAPVLNKIFHKNDTEGITFKYVCVKMELESDGLRGIVRTCQKHWSDIADVCDFMTKELDSKFNLKSCNVCDSDNCNGGSLVSVNLLAVIVGVFLFTFI